MKHIVIEKKEQCCACGACVNACAVGAITMKEDAAGFLFPHVDETKCVACGRCADVCVFTKENVGAGQTPEVFAAAVQNSEVLSQSSSGGVFSALAEAVIDKGGAVFGAAWDDTFSLVHLCAENKADLKKLRGSKYVQSETGDTFRQVKECLKADRYVCYCGTPCQIAGLKAFLGKEEEKLLCLDLVCHGVPSMQMLRDDLRHVAGEDFERIRAIRFRDKQFGWDVKGSLDFGEKTIKYHAGNSPYYFYFLKGEVYRESCYRCRFPGENRQGDITLGDYWGIRGELLAQMGEVNPDAGVSCLLVNTPKGKQWLREIEAKLTLAPTSLESVQKRNGQLAHTSKPLPEHEALLNGYLQNGYAAFQSGFKKHFKDRAIQFAKDLIPAKVKRRINDLIR